VRSSTILCESETYLADCSASVMFSFTRASVRSFRLTARRSTVPRRATLIIKLASHAEFR